MNSVTVKIYKAGSLREDIVPSLCIEATAPTTDEMFNTKTWPQIQEFFDGEAKIIVDAMVRSLPGGTIDAVLRELLTRKACLLRVTL